jgi:putative transposase
MMVSATGRHHAPEEVAHDEARPWRAACSDLIQRNVVAARRDQLWVADITYVPTWSGFL